MSANLDTPSRRQSKPGWPATSPKPGRQRPRSTRKKLLTDRQWSRVSPILMGPGPGTAANREELRQAFEGVLWILRRGAAWSSLPQTICCRDFARREWQSWMKNGRWLDTWKTYVTSLDSDQWLEWSRALIRAGEVIADKDDRGRDASARYAWWLVSARVFLWDAPWLPGAERKRAS